MNPLKLWFEWRDKRDYDRDRAVLHAIRMLHPDQAHLAPIAHLARLSPARTLVVLARLMKANSVRSEWADSPHPWRALYRLAPSAEEEAAA